MDIEDLDLALALRRLADASEPPPIDPRREAALLAAFDAAVRARSRPYAPGPTSVSSRPVWGMVALASAAAMLIATVLVPIRVGRHGLPSAPSSGRDVQLEAPIGEFVIVPGAAGLPPLESGSLVRIDLPVAMLPSLGLAPPAGSKNAVRADLIIGQDGLTRAVRLVD